MVRDVKITSGGVHPTNETSLPYATENVLSILSGKVRGKIDGIKDQG